MPVQKFNWNGMIQWLAGALILALIIGGVALRDTVGQTETRVENLEGEQERTNEDHEKIIVIEIQLENIAADVGEIKTKQEEQRTILEEINRKLPER